MNKIISLSLLTLLVGGAAMAKPITDDCYKCINDNQGAFGAQESKCIDSYMENNGFDALAAIDHCKAHIQTLINDKCGAVCNK